MPSNSSIVFFYIFLEYYLFLKLAVLLGGGGGGVHTPYTPPLHPHLTLEEEKTTYLKLVGGVSGNW